MVLCAVDLLKQLDTKLILGVASEYLPDRVFQRMKEVGFLLLLSLVYEPKGVSCNLIPFYEPFLLKKTFTEDSALIRQTEVHSLALL